MRYWKVNHVSQHWWIFYGKPTLFTLPVYTVGVPMANLDTRSMVSALVEPHIPTYTCAWVCSLHSWVAGQFTILRWPCSCTWVLPYLCVKPSWILYLCTGNDCLYEAILCIGGCIQAGKFLFLFFVLFLHSFFPEGQDWTESTSSLYLSPLLSEGKIPGEKSLVKNPP